MLRSGGKATGVKLRPNTPRAKGIPEAIMARKAVVSNASVWDTQHLLPGSPQESEWRQDALQTPMTGSFMHLHLGEKLACCCLSSV